MRVALIVMAVALAVAVQMAFAEDKDKQEPTAAPTNTYFGVDANNPEAVKEVVDQMNKDKFKELFGDIDVEQIDFTPKDGQITDEAFAAVAKGLSSLLDIFRTGTTSTTPAPTSQ